MQTVCRTACFTERCFSGWLLLIHVVPVGETRIAYRFRWRNLNGRNRYEKQMLKYVVNEWIWRVSSKLMQYRLLRNEIQTSRTVHSWQSESVNKNSVPCILESHFLRESKCWNRKTHCRITCEFVLGATAPSGPGPPHSRGSWITHNDAPQSVGILWTSDQLVAETSTWQHTKHSQQDSNPQSQQASGCRPTP